MMRKRAVSNKNDLNEYFRNADFEVLKHRQSTRVSSIHLEDF